MSREYSQLLSELDKRGTDSTDIYSQAAGAIRQLRANVGGGDTAIRQLENENEGLRNAIERIDQTLRRDSIRLAAEVERLQRELDRLRGVANVLADRLAQYNGTTTPQTIRWAEKQVDENCAECDR